MIAFPLARLPALPLLRLATLATLCRKALLGMCRFGRRFGCLMMQAGSCAF